MGCSGSNTAGQPKVGAGAPNARQQQEKPAGFQSFKDDFDSNRTSSREATLSLKDRVAEAKTDDAEVWIQRAISSDRDKINYFFKVHTTKAGKITIGLMKHEGNGGDDSEYDSDYMGGSDDSDDYDESDDDAEETEKVKSWTFQFWDGQSVSEDIYNDGKPKKRAVAAAQNLNVKANDIITMQLDKDKLLFWINSIAIGVVHTDKEMNESDVNPFIILHDKKDKIEICDGTWSN